MWLLSCDDAELLQGKKLWLRPGSAHLLGRTSSKHASTGERVRYIDHKTVSRKHLVLSIAAVKLGDSSRIFSRSLITASDGSRSGSTIDDEPLKQATKTLEDKDTHTIQLGSMPTLFKLEWRPVVLTITNVTKKDKTNGTALKQEREMLEGADIKLSLDYLPNTTTHTIAKKRNTPYGLQALLQAKWLVTDSFVYALADKCKVRGGDGAGDPGCSPLEDDFDANWPNEMDFLVPIGNEPVHRPNDFLKPDPARASIFSDHTFLFLAQDQLDILMPVIAAGGGKAVLCEYVTGRTTADDVIGFIKQLVGKGNDRNFLLSQVPGPGGVVIVRNPEKAGGRSDDFLSDLSIALNQRTIEQNELLDAILTQDVRSFRRELRTVTQSTPMESASAASSSNARPPTSTDRDPGPSRGRNANTASNAASTGSQHPSRSTQNAARSQQGQFEGSEQQSTRRPWKRTATTRSNITFNDFDPTEAVPDSDSSDENEQPSHAPGVQTIEVDETSQHQTSETQLSGRKRPAAEIVEAEEDEEALRQKQDDRLFPALALSKRRKTEAAARGEKSAVDPTPEPERARKSKSQETQKEEPTKDKGKVAKGRWKKLTEDGIAMRERMRARAEADDEERRRDEEDMQRTDIDLKDYKHTIAEFDVPLRPREEAVSQTQNLDNHPEWRGRKNFKGFRSNKNKADHRPAEFETQAVVIRLELVPGKGNGLGGDYWLESSKKKGSQSQSQSQHRQSGKALPTANGTEVIDSSGDEDDELAFRRRVRQSREEDAANAAVDDELDGDPTPSKTKGRGAQKKGNGKRPAVGLSDISAPAPKRAKPTPMGRTRFRKEDSEDSDDDDPLAFRRKRR